MSPEQVRPDGEVGLAANGYGLGVTLYEAITGDVPFRGTVSAIHRQIVSDEPRPPRASTSGYRGTCRPICLKCLEKDPRKRYRTPRPWPTTLTAAGGAADRRHGQSHCRGKCGAGVGGTGSPRHSWSS